MGVVEELIRKDADGTLSFWQLFAGYEDEKIGFCIRGCNLQNQDL